jgi:hypothetical protein
LHQRQEIDINCEHTSIITLGRFRTNSDKLINKAPIMKKKTTTATPKKTSSAGKTAKPVAPKVSVTNKETSAPAKTTASKATKKSLPLPNVTTIIATADIGWGNQLYLRGEGGGLSWESGVPMTCNGADEWVWVSTSNDPIFQFKFILNDKFWSKGDNNSVPRGDTHKSAPSF